jgi:MoaA/NifB/PqqE/SkfB family radical SAM enzyme
MGTNKFLKLNRVEYVITDYCTGRCKHCSVIDRIQQAKGHLHYEKMKGVLSEICRSYKIDSVMCFGGEPLLFPEEVEGILYEASVCGINKREIITNGYFNKSAYVIADVVFSLEEAEVTNILLSVDAFHQEKIPIESVYEFAKKVIEGNIINIKLHPAWLVDKDNDNPWNKKTKEILEQFNDLGIPISKGNSIVPSGNAVEFLSEYYPKQEIDLSFHCGQAVYSSKLDEVNSISIIPNGDVCVCGFSIGNVYREDINTILNRYDPNEIPMMKILLEDGVKGLMEYVKERGVIIDESKHHSACSVCREIIKYSKEGRSL